MTRLIITCLLAAALVTVAIIEQAYMHRSYQHLQNELAALTQSVYSVGKEDSVDTPENLKRISAMYDYWVNREKILYLFIRQTDMSRVTDEIVYIKNFIYYDNKEEAAVAMSKLKYILHTYKHNARTGIQNIL